MSTTIEEQPKEKVKSMFCEVDRAHGVNDDGTYKNHISSSTPSYMVEKGIKGLEAKSRDREDALEAGRVGSQAKEHYKRELIREKKRLHDIREQTPKFTQNEMAHIKSSFDALEREVASSLYTETDMETMRGVNPQTEADRMTDPCILIDKWLAESCNVKVDKKGKTSRVEAEMALKMANWHLTSGGLDGGYRTDNLRRKMGGNAAKSSQVTVGVDIKDGKVYRGDQLQIMEAIEASNARIKELEEKLAQGKAKNVKEYPEWKCEEEGCDYVGTTKNKGIHMGLHVRQANIKAKELASLENKEG